MNKDWTDIIRDAALDEEVRLPQDDYDVLQSKYAAHRRRRARTVTTCLGSLAAVCLGLALVLTRPGAEMTEGPVVAQQIAETCDASESAGNASAADCSGRGCVAAADCLQSGGFAADGKLQRGLAAGEKQQWGLASEVKQPTETVGGAKAAEKDCGADASEMSDGGSKKITEGKEEFAENKEFSLPDKMLLADAGLEIGRGQRRSGRVSVAVSGSLTNTLKQTQPGAGAGRVVEVKNAIKRFELPEKGKEEPISYSHFPMPLEFAVTVKWDALDWLSLVGGVQYSLLTSNCGLPNRRFVQQNVSYLGLPVAVNLVGRTSFGLSYYLSGGALVEKCIYAHRGTERLSEKGLQYALTAGAGLQYDFTRVLGIFLEPQLNYYLTESAFETRRSSGPLSFGMSMGLRFNL